MKYNHFQYCESLARRLKPIAHTDDECHFFRASQESNLTEINRNINSLRGMILIALDAKYSQFEYNDSDSLIEKPMYGVVVVKQTDTSDSDTIFAAQEEAKEVVKEIISRMLCDARGYRHGCEYIDKSSLFFEGFGPIGGCFYGVELSFFLKQGINYEINKEMWL